MSVLASAPATARRMPAWPEVVTIGETMGLMRAQDVGPFGPGTTMAVGIGGAESNFAIALRRLGTTVAWAGRVGNDSLGALIVRELTAEGIEVLASTDSHAPTALMLKERRTTETQKVWYYRQGMAGSRLSAEELPFDHIAQARLLHVTGISLGLSESARAAVRRAAEFARDNGTLVSFDLNYRSALWPGEEAGEAFREFLPLADFVFAGDDEAALAVGAGDPLSLARRIVQYGPRHAVIKRGAQGCAAHIDGGDFLQDAVPIRAVDTVGAGDGFVAGYLAEFLQGRSPAECLSTGVAVGAFACLVPGDWEGMPRRHELDLLTATEPVAR